MPLVNLEAIPINMKALQNPLVRFHIFPINMKDLQKMTVTKSVPESVFGKTSGLYEKFHWK